MTATTDNPTRGNRWYQQPVAWLGIAITLAIIGGCAWTIAIGSRYTDVHTHGDAPTLLGMPLTAPDDAGKTEHP